MVSLREAAVGVVYAAIARTEMPENAPQKMSGTTRARRAGKIAFFIEFPQM